MWSFFAAIFNIVANWFRAKKKEERQEIIETANEAGKVSAEITRKTEQATEHETTEIKKRECKKICVNGILRKTFRGLQNAYQQRAY